MIQEQWDELLRLAGSLHDGTVTASLLVAWLHAQQRRSRLAAALQDYGQLIKTEFILRYLTHPPDRRGIHRQLNKHESINALEDAVFYGNEGRIRLQTIDRQSTQAAALALVSAAIVTWNTHHMNEIVERERAAGRLPTKSTSRAFRRRFTRISTSTGAITSTPTGHHGAWCPVAMGSRPTSSRADGFH